MSLLAHSSYCTATVMELMLHQCNDRLCVQKSVYGSSRVTDRSGMPTFRADLSAQPSLKPLTAQEHKATDQTRDTQALFICSAQPNFPLTTEK